MKLQAEKINIISFLKGIIDSFRFMAHQKELELVFHPETEIEDITLYIDPRKMEDVMSNLLVNAFKFTPPGGKITVTVKQKATEQENNQKLLRMLHGSRGAVFSKRTPLCFTEPKAKIFPLRVTLKYQSAIPVRGFQRSN